MKKISMQKYLLFFTLLLAVSFFSNTQKVNAQTATQQSLTFRELTGPEMTAEMGAGWNLGNTMDGHTGFDPSETVWQSVKTTKEFIKSVHDLGFNTIRIPVTWGTMIDDEDNFSINEEWISRVQDIADYAIEQDMYVIINIHHDGAEQSGWLRIATDDKASLYKKFAGVWSTISERFKDYDEHLIFEAMNEVKGENMTLAEENQVIMDLNQIFVNTVRSTGSNNEKRWLVVCGKYNYINSLVSEEGAFQLPVDSVADRLILSVHIYTPWNFCGAAVTSGAEYSIEDIISKNLPEISQLQQFTDQGIPVIVGEYGCINKNNTEYRALYVEAMNKLYSVYHLNGIYWDQGWYDLSLSPDYSFSILDRTTGLPIYKQITDAIMRGYFSDSDKELENITLNTTITEITDIEFEDSILLTIGENTTLSPTITPQDSDDVLLYKTEDPSIATVYNGTIRARGIGTTTITVFSQSGSVSSECSITVVPEVPLISCTDINSDFDSLDLMIDDYQYLNASVTPQNCTSFLTYKSEDESVATVSSIGKILAIGEGTTQILVTSSDGFIKNIPVTVHDQEEKSEIRLALNVYYNDAEHEYYSNEVSNNVITVTDDGQYTLSFNCHDDLSEKAQNAGITSLKNLTAVYIKDFDVTTNASSVSPLVSCDIQYDHILVNGVEQTINTILTKSALKDSGIFDTNDPLNAWDGSLIDEITVNNYVLNLTSVSDPTEITVIFTLSNMKFKGDEILTEDSSSTSAKDEAVNEEINSEKDLTDTSNTDPTDQQPETISTDKTSAAPIIILLILAMCGAGLSTYIFYYRHRKSR